MKGMMIGLMSTVMLMVSVSTGFAADNVIAEGKTAKFHYTLTVDGKVADSSQGKEPLEYVHGKGMIIPGLEKELLGLNVGDKKTVTVKPEEGYGQTDPRGILEIAKERIDPRFAPEKGMVLQLPMEGGQVASGVIAEVKENSVVVDFNHPMAGKTLNFDIEVVEIK